VEIKATFLKSVIDLKSLIFDSLIDGNLKYPSYKIWLDIIGG
jgi:hypothetical protein